MAKTAIEQSGGNGAVSRRAVVVTSLAGLVGLPFLAGRGTAKEFDHPPVFSTKRYQFTMIEPAAQMPSVTLMDDKGKPKRLAAEPGKILLLNFWATWCEACRYDLPLLERFATKFANRINVAAVSTDSAGELGKVGPYLRELSIRSLPIYLDPDGHLARNSLESEAAFSLAYGMPVTYLITPSGRIAGYILGVADWLSADAQKLLAYYADA